MDGVVDEQPAEWITYHRYSLALVKLIASTKHIGLSAAIFAVIINQAHRLNKPPEWIEQEILFEAGITNIGDRSEWLRQAMDNEGLTGDASNDLYNERLTRYTY